MISAFPADMPDLKESTNHLAPLTIPAQVAVHFNGTPGRVGFEVCSISFWTERVELTPCRILLKNRSFALKDTGFGNGCQQISKFNGGSMLQSSIITVRVSGLNFWTERPLQEIF